jgi:hypothetical protein
MGFPLEAAVDHERRMVEHRAVLARYNAAALLA